MSLINNFSEKLQQIKQGIDEKKDFKTQLIEICKDGKITEREIEYIEQLAEKYEIRDKDLQKVNVQAYRTALNEILKDGVLTEDEEYNIRFIQKFLEIDDRKITSELQTLQYHAQVREIKEGNLPIIRCDDVILKNNETIHFTIFSELLEERVVSKSYQGGSSGVNIRVAKGLSFNVGSHKGKIVNNSAVIAIDSGDFIVTNERIIFKGRKKSYAYTFSQLVGFTVYTNAIEINTSRGVTRTFKVTYSNKYEPDLLNLIIKKSQQLYFLTKSKK